MRVGMFLEIATTLGAVAGAHLISIAPASALAIIFGAVLLYSAWHSLQQRTETLAPEAESRRGALETRRRLPHAAGQDALPCAARKGGVHTDVRRRNIVGICWESVPGAMKVVAMDQIMRIPFKASTTTSNFMIGVTAAASAGIYLSRGYIDPRLAMPVMLGVLGGSLTGARLLTVAGTRSLRLIFAVVVAALAAEMIYHGITGRI